MRDVIDGSFCFPRLKFQLQSLVNTEQLGFDFQIRSGDGNLRDSHYRWNGFLHSVISMSIHNLSRIY